MKRLIALCLTAACLISLVGCAGDTNMDEKNDLIKVGKYDLRYNELLSIDIEELDIFRSKGLPAHMVKRKHFNCLKYIDYLPEIIENPDYVGVNPNENDKSIEFIKKYSKNVLVGVKLEKDGQYLYVSSMYDIQDSKISRRLYSGRIKNANIDNNENK